MGDIGYIYGYLLIFVFCVGGLIGTFLNSLVQRRTTMSDIQPSEYKEVYYDQYCKKCKHKDEEPLEDTPCDECLDTPVNLYSHKPVKFEEV